MKTTDAELIVELTKENRELRKALKFIADWELPKSHYLDWSRVNAGLTKEPTKVPCSYEAAHGSNGVRDYVRTVAVEALKD